MWIYGIGGVGIYKVMLLIVDWFLIIEVDIEILDVDVYFLDFLIDDFYCILEVFLEGVILVCCVDEYICCIC